MVLFFELKPMTLRNNPYYGEKGGVWYLVSVTRYFADVIMRTIISKVYCFSHLYDEFKFLEEKIYTCVNK